MPSCHAIGANKALSYAALWVQFWCGKVFIPFPLKMAFYCVTNPQRKELMKLWQYSG